MSENPVDGVTIITGGSRGIGAACAVRLATDRPDRPLMLSYASDEAAARTVAQDVEAVGGRAEIHRADVADEADVIALFEAADGLGPVTGLVNNAGLLFTAARLEDFDAGRVRRTMDVNVTGSFLCAREAVKRMSTDNGGSGGVIVNLS